MTRKRNPKAACDGGTPLTPITAKERREFDERLKKKYDRFRRRYLEIDGKVVDFVTHSSIDQKAVYPVEVEDQNGANVPIWVRLDES